MYHIFISMINSFFVPNAGTFYGDLMRKTSPIVSALSLEYDVVISRAFVARERFERERSPFLLNVRREGVVI